MLYQSVALRQTTRRSGFSAGEGAAGEGAAANGSLTERRSSSYKYTRQSANYVDGGETERRSATTDATTHGNDGRPGATDGSNGRLRRTAATADERLGYDGLYAPVRQEGHMH